MHTELKRLIANIVQQQLSPEAWQWLTSVGQQIVSTSSTQAFNTAFALMPRKTGRQLVMVTAQQSAQINTVLPGYQLTGYTTDRLCRCWLLMQLPSTDEDFYYRTIENLFAAAEMNEQVAVYSALPLLTYPNLWVSRCAEGIRSNIGTVLEAIMYHNPYPAAHLNQSQWNQLVLKAFFTDKDINQISGIDQRANQELANTLLDYASERNAAARAVNPQLWRLVAPFINQNNLHYFASLLQGNEPAQRNASALACYQNAYEPARLLLAQYPQLQNMVQQQQVTWQSLTHQS